jgi:hypothetical protein
MIVQLYSRAWTRVVVRSSHTVATTESQMTRTVMWLGVQDAIVSKRGTCVSGLMMERLRAGCLCYWQASRAAILETILGTSSRSFHCTSLSQILINTAA